MSTSTVVQGLVSVIVPVFNRPELLECAVRSALDQTYRPIEIVIVDDESTDETPGVIDRLSSSHPEVRAVRRENGGPGAARETGRLEARGEFIQYLDSDDVLLPGKLAAQVDALRTHPQGDVAYGRTRYRDSEGRLIECTWKNPNQRHATMFPSFLLARWWETATPLYRRRITDAAGPWSTLRLEEDWEYDCRIAAQGGRLLFVDQDVAEHRDHGATRLSRGRARDPLRLRDRAAAHASIYASAVAAGLAVTTPEMHHFSRALFLLSRQCGAAGLDEESRMLFDLARKADAAGGTDMQYRVYSAAARLMGWHAAGVIAEAIDRLRYVARRSEPGNE